MRTITKCIKPNNLREGYWYLTELRDGDKWLFCFGKIDISGMQQMNCIMGMGDSYFCNNGNLNFERAQHRIGLYPILYVHDIISCVRVKNINDVLV